MSGLRRYVFLRTSRGGPYTPDFWVYQERRVWFFAIQDIKQVSNSNFGHSGTGLVSCTSYVRKYCHILFHFQKRARFLQRLCLKYIKASTSNTSIVKGFYKVNFIYQPASCCIYQKCSF